MYFIFVTDSVGAVADRRRVGRYDRPTSGVDAVDYRQRTHAAGLLDEGPDVNWPAKIQFIRWRLAFQETHDQPIAAWRVWATDVHVQCAHGARLGFQLVTLVAWSSSSFR